MPPTTTTPAAAAAAPHASVVGPGIGSAIVRASAASSKQ